MTILRARETRHFLYLFVRCTCGCRFGHRADRRVLVCYVCGRVADLGRVKTKEQARRKVLSDRRRRLRAARTTVTITRGNGRGHGNGQGTHVAARPVSGSAEMRAPAPRRSATRRAV